MPNKSHFVYFVGRYDFNRLKNQFSRKNKQLEETKTTYLFETVIFEVSYVLKKHKTLDRTDLSATDTKQTVISLQVGCRTEKYSVVEPATERGNISLVVKVLNY